jgi:two-component system, sensor histidine kinase and response regulator
MRATPAAASEKEHAAIAAEDIIWLLTTLAEAIDRADPEEIRKITNKVTEQLTDVPMINQAALAALTSETQRYDYDQALETLKNIQKAVEEYI